MRCSAIAKRYASALYSLAKENQASEKIFSDLRELKNIFEQNKKINNLLISPLIQSNIKESFFKSALKESGLSQMTEHFIYLLAKKNRLGLFYEIVKAYELKSDTDHGVTRGVVQSASVLSGNERIEVESMVAQATKKQVILKYEENASLIGGVVVEVGSYTFDDSLASHLKRLKDELKRRSH